MGRGSAAGEFWVGQGGERRGRPPTVCSARTNAVQAGKTRRPEGLGGKGPPAALLVGHRPLRVCSLLAPCQSNPSLPNRTPPHFQTGSDSSCSVRPKTPPKRRLGNSREAVPAPPRAGLTPESPKRMHPLPRNFPGYRRRIDGITTSHQNTGAQCARDAFGALLLCSSDGLLPRWLLPHRTSRYRPPYRLR